MIPCRFVYRFRDGGASDSLDRVYQVHTVPRVGEEIQMVSENGTVLQFVVLEITHSISQTEGTHEVIISYSPPES